MIAFEASQFANVPPAFMVMADICPTGQSGAIGAISDVAKRIIDEAIVGETSYQLRRPVTLTFYPFVSGGHGELIQEPNPLGHDEYNVIGRGKTYEEALADWSARLHTRVQTLLAKREWERDPEEQEEMAALERLIDVPAYLKATPLRLRQIGMVSRRRPMPDRVRWEDGSYEPVGLDQMPAEFAAFHAGQRFEAIVIRSPGTRKLLRVVHVHPLPRLGQASVEEWNELPTTAQAPTLAWDKISFVKD
ncbi:MAG TPA: hypothetical protein VH092_02310 [Urbifossiella sp.]|nr:hypothetical protein [Urbifossiella sp.]